MNFDLHTLRSTIRSLFGAKNVRTQHNSRLRPGQAFGMLGVAGAALALSPLPAWSNQIYTVNIAFPSASVFPPDEINSVTGTITTDGTTGSLAGSDFVSFDLDVTFYDVITNTSGATVALTGTAVTCGSGGCGMSASATQLSFTPAANEIVTFPTTLGKLSLGPEETIGSITGWGGEALHYNPFAYSTPFYSGTDSIVVGTPQGSVPEPGSLALAALALAGLAATRRARRSQRPAAGSPAAA